jgi:hypothetical protein
LDANRILPQNHFCRAGFEKSFSAPVALKQGIPDFERQKWFFYYFSTECAACDRIFYCCVKALAKYIPPLASRARSRIF